MTEPYSLVSSEGLYQHFKDNIDALAGYVREVLGDEPIPDPRDMQKILSQTSFAQYWDLLVSDKAELASTMDLQELLVTITQENVEIHKELLRRMP